MRRAGCIVLLILFSVMTAGYSDAGDSCGECHGNSGKMKEAGYQQFALSPAEVKAQTHMPASCPDCHLGDPGEVGRQEAHRGMLMLQAILGVSARAHENMLTVNKPHLPPWLNVVELRNLRVGSSMISLVFRREGEITGFSLLDRKGDVRVLMEE